MFARAARLPRVEIKDPGKVIGTNTITHMQAGLYYGAVDMVDGMLARMKKELGEGVKVIATGGQARLQDGPGNPRRVIAFLSHVQTDLAERARSAGCAEVMPRSKFTQNLAEILRGAKT